MDTKQNKRIVPFIKNSNLLISEGTYSKELEKEAKERMHLTVTQASEFAKKGKVKKLILTHIGGRHLKEIKEILKEAKAVFPETIIAKDFDKFEV